MLEMWRKVVSARSGGLRQLALGLSVLAVLGLSADMAWAAKKLGPKDEQPRPIPLGVSGSSIEPVLADGNLWCYSGTLGSLVERTGNPATQLILSNNHVLAKENYPDLGAGDVRSNLEPFVVGVDGNNVIQPSLGDVKGPCTLGDTNDIVATLSDYVLLDLSSDVGNALVNTDNTVDAAIAAVITPGAVDPDGTIFGIGTVSSTHLLSAAVVVGLKVQKAGRTSGHTFGTVEATDVTVLVQYDSGFGLFRRQIRIRGACGEDFSMPGDSGSLILNVPEGGDRQAVGLLFAGGDLDTFGNPIGEVLSRLNVSMAKCQGTCDHANVTDETPKCKGGGGGGRPSGRGGSRSADVDPAGLAIAADVKDAHSADLLEIPGVVGHGVSVDENGQPVIEVYIEKAGGQAVGRPIPSELDGIAVRVVETGVIRAF